MFPVSKRDDAVENRQGSRMEALGDTSGRGEGGERKEGEDRGLEVGGKIGERRVLERSEDEVSTEISIAKKRSGSTDSCVGDALVKGF